MISPGDGIAIASVCGVTIAGILRFVPTRKSNGSVTRSFCDERSGNITHWMEKIDKRLERIETSLKK